MLIGRVIWEGRRWIEIAVFLFVVGLLLGLTFARTNGEEVVLGLQPLLQQLRGIQQDVTTSTTPLERAWVFFRWNSVRAAGVLLLGLLGGIAPVLFVLVNGLLVGFLVGIIHLVQPGVSGWDLFLSIAPHGIFELPAIFLAAAWGMKLGIGWLLPQAEGQRLETLKETGREAWIVLLVVLVLLAIAGFVEGNVTFALVSGRSAG